MSEKTNSIITTLAPESMEPGVGSGDEPAPGVAVLPVTDALLTAIRRAVNAVVTGGLASATIDIFGHAAIYGGSLVDQQLRGSPWDGAVVGGDPIGCGGPESLPVDGQTLQLDMAANGSVFGVIQVAKEEADFSALLNLTELLGIKSAFAKPGSAVAQEGFEGIMREVWAKYAEGPDEAMEGADFVALVDDDDEDRLVWDFSFPFALQTFAEQFVPDTEGLMALVLAEPEWLSKAESDWEPYTDQEPPLRAIVLLHEVVRQAIQGRLEAELS